MADGDIDPRYAARFQRGSHHESPVDAAGRPAAVEAPAQPVMKPRGRVAAIAGLAVAVALAALAVGALFWVALDPAFVTAPVPDPVAAFRVIARTSAGPLVVAAVVCAASGLGALELSRRAAITSGATLAVAAAAVVVWVSTEIARLAGLTAQGPVSPGGVPLPESGLAAYAQRVLTIELLRDALPWFVLAVGLAVAAAIALIARVAPRPGALVVEASS